MLKRYKKAGGIEKMSRVRIVKKESKKEKS